MEEVTPEPNDLSAGSEMLSRSARALRESSDPGWDQASQRVLAAVRSATRRSWPLDATFPEPDGDDRLAVSDQVVISLLRRSLESVESCAPSRITLQLDEHECTGVELSLVIAYGTDVRAIADRARELVLTTLDDVLGPPAFARRTATVDVLVDDVTPGDPRA